MHFGISNLIFILALGTAVFFFARRLKQIIANINLGKDQDISDNKALRWKTMARVALGQSKMTVRPVAGFLHILVYVGFVIINLEVLEIIIDGIFGTHRVFAFLGPVYNLLIGSFEVLALLVLVACVIFLVRRNVLNIKRFHLAEMTKWPKNDANIILITEILLMWAFLSMNAADYLLQLKGTEHYVMAGSFPVSQFLEPIFSSWSEPALIAYERGAWWFHILGILAFLNYVPYSKHLHIFFAFPNTYYSNLNPKGKFSNNEAVTKEVKLMMDPSADPYANAPSTEEALPSFGAKDVEDLSWKNLLDAYSCTECGRCSSVCPANITGKKLSPRKIMMDTRDRAEEVGQLKRSGKGEEVVQKALLGDYISEEELWACTSCNACTDACPVNIDPLNIIVELRRNLVMEQSKMPEELMSMTNNVQNNAAPWAFGQADRLNWKDEA